MFRRSQIETVLLDRVRYRVQRSVSGQLRANARHLDLTVERIAEELVVALEVSLAGKTTERRWQNVHRSTRVVASVEVPANWWEHLKQAWNRALGWDVLYAKQFAMYGWRIRTRQIATRLETVTHNHHVATTKVCPHVPLPDERGGPFCVRWLAEPEALRPEWAEADRRS